MGKDGDLQKNYEAGQSWSYETPPGYEDSRIVIGAIEEVEGVGEIICIRLTNAPLPSPGSSGAQKGDIGFIPFTREAIDKSVKKMEGKVEVGDDFEAIKADWLADTKGEDYMPIPVPLFLDMLAAGANG